MSKQSISILALTLLASGAIVKHRGITIAGAQATNQGEKVLGVSQTDAADTEAVAVETIGTTVVETGAAIAVGDSLIVDVQGRAIPVTGNLGVGAGATAMTSSAANGDVLTGGDLPEYVFADALVAAAAAGEFIEVALRR
ncbi:MAG: DUF2190 family protein [Rhodospirillales bacterium]|nr:DUF2190 family protein [Rhodospirillales bacterium]